jgi:hypothetical protein
LQDSFSEFRKEFYAKTGDTYPKFDCWKSRI